MNPMKFNKTKYRVLHLVQGSLQCQYRLTDDDTESSSAEKDLGVLLEDKLNVS